MLESMMKKLSGVVLGGVIVLLSGVFILQFGGPQSQGCQGQDSQNVAAKVYGKPISRADLRAGFVIAGGDRYPPELAKQYQLKEMVLMGLVEEALLAREARALGYSVSEDDVMMRVAEDGVIYTPMSVEANPMLQRGHTIRYNFTDEDGKFSKEVLKRNFIQGSLQRSVRDFAESQIQATLADRMRKTVMASARVSPGEIWQEYVREKEGVTIKYARFSSVYFGDSLKVSDADLTAWMEANTEAVDKEYEQQKHRYTGLEKQVRARHILIKVDSSESDEDKAAAKERAEKLLARAKQGEDFATLARENSEDTGSAKQGGDLGYNPKGRMVAAFDEAQFALPVGGLSDVVESSFGFHVIKVEGIREGDVPVEEAKRELADKLYRKAQADKRAKEAADAALAKLKAGTEIDALDAEWKAQAGKGEDESPDPLAPQFRDTRPFGRAEGPTLGGFDSTPLAKAAWELEEDAPLPDAPIKLGDDYFVYRLETKTLASKEEFTPEEEQRVRAQLLNAKREEVYTNYVRMLVQKAREENALAMEPQS